MLNKIRRDREVLFNLWKKLARGGPAAVFTLCLSACDPPPAKECAARSVSEKRAVCAPSHDGREAAFLIDKTVFLKPGRRALEGTGRVLFQQALLGLNSKELFALRAEFFHESSRLILHSHFPGFSNTPGDVSVGGAAGGVRVLFVRDAGALIIEAGSGGYNNQTLARLDGFFGGGNRELDIYVAVQNGGPETVHIQAWNRLINPSGRLKTRDAFISGGNLIADSSGKPFYSKGKGILWGLDLYKIRLSEAERKSWNVLF